MCVMSKSVARVRGIEMAYDDTGGSGAALVLLHGFPLDRSMWRGQAEALGGGFRVVAPDLRGLGETPLGDVGVSIKGMAEDVAALLDELNLGRVVLGGLSMGGYVAFEFFRKFPNRVCALVLADTRPQADTEEGRREVFERVRAMILGTSPEGAAAALRAMASRRDQTDLLSSINVPTLIVV